MRVIERHKTDTMIIIDYVNKAGESIVPPEIAFVDDKELTRLTEYPFNKAGKYYFARECTLGMPRKTYETRYHFESPQQPKKDKGIFIK